MTSASAQQVDVLIVDDHELVRLGIRRLLEEAGLRVAEAESGEAALQGVGRVWDAHVVLMDIHMPGIGGLEATRRLLARDNDLRIIILTATTGGPLPRALLMAGAAGYLTKGSSLEEMTRAIRKVRAGEKYITAEIAQYLALSLLDGDQRTPLDQLSNRELQFVVLTSQGLGTNAIAETMSVSPKTVSTYRQRVMHKLAVTSEAELIRFALDHGVADPS